MSFNEQTYETIEAYLDQVLSDTERIAFEERIKNDPDLANEVTINREMRIQYGNSNTFTTSKYAPEIVTNLKSHIQSKETEELSRQIKEGKKLYDKNLARKKTIIRYMYATVAAVALIFLISTFFINQDLSTEELYAQNSNWENLPSLTVKGENQQNLAKGEALFNAKKYTEAISYFEGNESNNPHVLIYLGISHLESNNYQKALATFNQLKTNNTLGSHKAYWYISLTYLKQGQKERAIAALQLLRQNQNNYQYDKAGELLSKLKD